MCCFIQISIETMSFTDITSESESETKCIVCKKEVDEVLATKVCKNDCYAHQECIMRERPERCLHEETIQYVVKGSCARTCGNIISDCCNGYCLSICKIILGIFLVLLFVFSGIGFFVNWSRIFAYDKLFEVGYLVPNEPDETPTADLPGNMILTFIFGIMTGFCVWMLVCCWYAGLDNLKFPLVVSITDYFQGNVKWKGYYLLLLCANILANFLGQITLSIIFQHKLFEVIHFGAICYIIGANELGIILIVIMSLFYIGLCIERCCVNPFRDRYRQDQIVMVDV